MGRFNQLPFLKTGAGHRLPYPLFRPSAGCTSSTLCKSKGVELWNPNKTTAEGRGRKKNVSLQRSCANSHSQHSPALVSWLSLLPLLSQPRSKLLQATLSPAAKELQTRLQSHGHPPATQTKVLAPTNPSLPPKLKQYLWLNLPELTRTLAGRFN